jgi:hypothetical protein
VNAYITKRLTVEAVQWTGTNLDEVRAFAGPDFIDAAGDGHLWIRNAEGPDQIHPGDWMSREPGMPLILHSPAAWSRLYEPSPEPPRSPDAADLTLAKIATPWAGLNHSPDNHADTQLAQALTAWLQARGIY